MKKGLVNELGGPTKVVELLGWKGVPGSVQRVSNWNKRGIPPSVLLEFPHVFSVAHDEDQKSRPRTRAA